MKVYFDTLGCQKNYNDSDIAMGLLENRGYEIAQTPEDADAIIVNTCGFIEDAKRESIAHIFEMAEISGEDQAKKLIKEVDKDRSSYYKYYTDQIWGESENYALCIDSSRIGVKGAVEVIKAYISALEQK